MSKLIVTLIEPDVQTVTVEFDNPNDIDANELIYYYVSAANAFGFSPKSIREAMLDKAEELENDVRTDVMQYREDHPADSG
jgi:hypothetical protein